MTAPTFAAPLKAGERTLDVDILTNVRRVIAAADAGTARSQQKAIGPSEHGHPCARRLAYKMLGQPEANTTQDPWARIVGTAVHAWLADAFLGTGELLDDGLTPRYRVEQRVNPLPGMWGTVDLLDRKLRGVIDWKIPGLTAVRRARKDGPGPTYRVQAHTYGCGYRDQGEPVDWVGVVMLPKAGTLADAYVWTEQLDPQVVIDADNRRADALAMAIALDCDEHPERFLLIPATESHCNYCPFYAGKYAPSHLGCPGADAA